jgi:hypothetical protein
MPKEPSDDGGAIDINLSSNQLRIGTQSKQISSHGQ